PYNPVAMLSQVDNRGERFNYAGNITATLRPVTGLKVVASLSSNNENYEASKYVSRESRYSILGNYDGSAEMSNYFYKTNTLEAYADYNWTDNVHNFGVMAGYSYSQTKRTWSNASNAGFLTDALGPNNIGNGTWLEEGLASMGRGEDESKLIAFFGRVNYSYKGRYLFNASIRREGSTRFGENNKWGWFPALSGAWRISEEPFMAGAKAVSNLKLRAGFGITGNQDIPLYASISKYNDLGYAYINGSWQKVYGPTTNPNPDLRWEKNTEYNVGVDAGLWDNRLTASVDYYYRKTTDLLDWYDAQVPSSIYNTIFTNVGTLTNQGVEVALGWDA
ncbi:TonB-dependent receptor domain-containing protein, partial [Alistipes putredinis]